MPTIFSCFLDIVGSSRLYEALGDTAAAEKIRNTLGDHEQRIVASGGSLIQSTGDGWFYAFNDERALATYLSDEAGPSEVPTRIGVHYGDVVSNGGTYYGDTINGASRLCDIGKPNQVLMSEAAYQVAADNLSEAGISARFLSPIVVKGKFDPIRTYEIVRPPLASEDSQSEHGRGKNTKVTAPAQREKAAKPASPRAVSVIRLTYRNQTIRLLVTDEPTTHAQVRIEGVDGNAITKPQLVLGRAESADLVLYGGWASREHCYIRPGHVDFVLSDKSANGTLVMVGEQSEDEGDFVHWRESILPRPKGAFRLGTGSKNNDDLDIVLYEYEV